MKRTHSLALFCMALPLMAQESIPLIPAPQQLNRQPGVFVLQKKEKISIAHEGDRFAAEQLAEEIGVFLKLRPRVQSKPNDRIQLRRWGKDPVWEAAWGDSLVHKLGEEGYVLEIASDRVRLTAATPRGVFYGVQTLRQIIRTHQDSLPCLRIADWPGLRYRGWQDDISRGPIPTLDFLKEEVRLFSSYKLNCMTLYTEHVFKLRSHPDIAPADGITAEEIAELQDFASDYHVELIGNFQSFGHFRHILKLPAYRHLRETRDVISPAFEESYEFLGDAFGEVAQAYDSPLFNINCDETFGLGTGPARAMKEKLGKAGLYAYHINRVYDLFKPFGKRLMMWGDIARDYPAIIPRLPSDLIVLPWAYHAAPSFDGEIAPFSRLGFDFMVCPGVSCWRQIWPNFDTAITNIAHFVRDGAAAGAMGMLNTSWDDDGENLFHYHWLPMLWGAEMAWRPIAHSDETVPAPRLNDFKAAFGPLFYGLPGRTAADLLFALSDLRRFKSAGGLDDSAFWAPLIPEEKPKAGDAAALSRRASGFAGAFEALSAIESRHPASLKAAAFAAKRTAVHGRLAALRNRLWRIAHGGQAINPLQLEATIDSLAAAVSALESAYVDCWTREARPWWLERNREKYRALVQSLTGLKHRVFITSDGHGLARARTVTLRPLFEADTLRYTTDGSPVSKKSNMYGRPFRVTASTTVGVAIERDGRLRPEVSQAVAVYNGPVQRITLVRDPEKQYRARGVFSLVDGERGTKHFRESREWMGFWYHDFEAVLDLGSVQPVAQLGLGCLQDSRAWIHYPQRVEFELSNDGVHYRSAVRIENDQSVDRDGAEVRDFLSPRLDESARFVRVKAKNMGLLPEWHKSAGGKSWLFVDEIIIR